MKQAKIFSALALGTAVTALLFTGCWWNDNDASSSSSKAPSSSMASSSSGSMGSSDTSGSLGKDDSMTADSNLNNSMSISGSTSGSMSGSGSVSSSGTSKATAPAAAIVGQEWNMVLVNAQNPLPEGFAADTRPIKGYENRLFHKRAADDLEQMLADAQAAGCPLYLVSAYRTPDRQTALFARKVQAFRKEGFDEAEAEKQAAQWVARPYTSEHNLGLAADIVSSDWYKTNSDLTEEFAQTPHYAWLQQHCAEYGFILRYPKGKEKITGVTYEPWHYRYVGIAAADAIMDSGIVLEEYCQ